MPSPIRTAAVVACLFLGLPSAARAELTPWDQAKVTELAKQLAAATSALSDSFRRQPPPQLGSSQRVVFHRLEQEVRHLRRESSSLARALERGADREQVQGSYESLMETVRRARDNARRLFSVAEMQERSDAALAILNQLRPYFEADTVPLEPVRRQ
jgi:signal transduction histidine kinase